MGGGAHGTGRGLSGREREEAAQRHSGMGPGTFRAVILGNFLFMQRPGMWLSVCQLSIYYKPIGLGPRTL